MVFYYHKLLGNSNLETVCEECKSGCRGCVACKKELVEVMMHFLDPIKEKRYYYENHPEEVDKVLIEGSKYARTIAKNTMKKVRKNMKIDYFEEEI